MDDDRRSIRRTRIVRNVTILANHVSIPCTILDLTNGGACISIAGTHEVPDQFELTFGSRHAHRACRVTWRAANQIGVAFIPSA
jgi:hypothetical protein